MEKTMLTYRTLDRFEDEYKTDNYNDAEIKQIEYAAYVANMNSCANPAWNDSNIFDDFLRVLGIHKVTVQHK